MITRHRIKINIPWKEREMSRELAPRIVVDAKIRFGKPVIQGTRVPVDLLVGKVDGA